MIGQIISAHGKPFLVYQDGSVKSFGTKRDKSGKILKPVIRKGYQYINVSHCGNHKQKAIHRLVAEAFIPNPDNKATVNHKNGIKADNRVENLEWATVSENTKHAFDNNLVPKRFGENNPATKLSNQQKAYIKRLLIFGATQKKVAELFKVSCALICQIKI